MHPDDLLQQLLDHANPQKQKNLEIVHAVCREQYERGSRDFSVATVARVAKARGGPAAQTIHNKTGDDFKGLIKAWADHTGGVTRKVRQIRDDPIAAVLDKIPDPAVRAVMGAQLAENKRLRGEVNLLKANANLVIDRRASTQATATGEPVEILPPARALTKTEIEALTHAISEAHMLDEGWTVDGHGRVLNAKGRTLFKVGYLTAIQKILRSQN
ncbi:gamma-mobile-trio protein GmtX [Hydrogenophaga sp.]|uniref:gamma-mobile-trio protein GmtX n=1 Tax=Hydrogenophaga sp. TaxID=1904254 RepID=UPI00272FA82A|nr:gamma-mobile-trio protein GmtX [Hydrogenophaga sp.]MDP1688171.1 gamma-mobile-trio protein GmtX [Hydrogenophaga sp.]